RMRDEDAEARSEAGDLCAPVRDQRRRHHQQAGFVRGAALLLQQHEQRDDLEGLAEPHIVGEASAKAQALEPPEPPESDLLIGRSSARSEAPGSRSASVSGLRNPASPFARDSPATTF